MLGPSGKPFQPFNEILPTRHAAHASIEIIQPRIFDTDCRLCRHEIGWCLIFRFIVHEQATKINVNGVEGQEPERGGFLKNLTLIYWRYTEAIRIEWSNSATWAKVHRNNMYDVNEDLREACSYVARFTFAHLARWATAIFLFTAALIVRFLRNGAPLVDVPSSTLRSSLLRPSSFSLIAAARLNCWGVSSVMFMIVSTAPE